MEGGSIQHIWFPFSPSVGERAFWCVFFREVCSDGVFDVCSRAVFWGCVCVCVRLSLGVGWVGVGVGM